MKPSQGTWWSSKAVTTCFLYTDTKEKKDIQKPCGVLLLVPASIRRGCHMFALTKRSIVARTSIAKRWRIAIQLSTAECSWHLADLCLKVLPRCVSTRCHAFVNVNRPWLSWRAPLGAGLRSQRSKIWKIMRGVLSTSAVQDWAIRCKTVSNNWQWMIPLHWSIVTKITPTLPWSHELFLCST